MPTTLKERVEVLEKQVQELADIARIGKASRGSKDWRRSFGMSADDAGFDEMVRLGAEIRRKSGVTDVIDT